MAKDPPIFEPRSFIAGATVVWKKSLADYPATEWTLKYAFRGAGATDVNVTATADGDDHLATIASATTTALAPGAWYWQAWVEKGTEKFFVGEGQTTVRKSLSAIASATHDGRSEAEIIYSKLVDLVKTKSVMLQQEYTIAGRQMQFDTHESLIKAANFWAGIVRDERRQRKMNQGGDFFDNVNIRF